MVMRKSIIKFGTAALSSLMALALFSCASTTQLQPGEEYVEYIDILKPTKNLRYLSEDQIKEDCNMLKYLFYNSYAGYEELAANGFDLEKVIDQIQTETLKKRPEAKGYDRSDFGSEILNGFAKNFNLLDQHISIWGNYLKNTYGVYYSDIYLEKKDNQYFVKKSEVENVKEGMLFTGIENNLFEMISADGEILYRYGVLTNKNVKSANISVENETFLVKVRMDDTIPQTTAWNGLKETEDTVYLSLSDCVDVSGLSDRAKFTEVFFNEYLQKVSAATKGKKNIIFDLRSNTGGYCEFPAKILTAACYNQHSDDDKKQIEALFLNSIDENCSEIISPTTMQKRKEIYENRWKGQFERLSEEDKQEYKDYWKTMKHRAVRKFRPAANYQCNLTEFPETDFKGNVYILINRRTASAAELGTAMAFYLQNKGIKVQLVGENSCGAVKYVGMWGYVLPNSGIWINVGAVAGLSPIFDEIPQFKGESKGFYPDYWATNETILKTLIEISDDAALKEVLEGLDKGLL